MSNIKSIINQCFPGIILVKMERRENFTTYVASLMSSYGDGKKQYLLVFVPDHLAILEKATVEELQWENLQTRILTNEYTIDGKKLRAQKWNLPKGIENFLFIVTDRSPTRTKYVSEHKDFEMLLIHDPKKKTQFQYHNHINLIAALTTFRCVISAVKQYYSVPIDAIVGKNSQRPLVTLSRSESSTEYTTPSTRGVQSNYNYVGEISRRTNDTTLSRDTILSEPASTFGAGYDSRYGLSRNGDGRDVVKTVIPTTKLQRNTPTQFPWINNSRRPISSPNADEGILFENLYDVIPDPS